MELRAAGLAFRITFTLPDGEGWMWCHAIIDAPGFHGDLDFPMLRSDLDSFRTQLADSIGEAHRPCDRRLVSTDPGIDLSFRVERTGQVLGEYRIGGHGAHRPMLSGTFEMDRTYLGTLLAHVDRTLADLA